MIILVLVYCYFLSKNCLPSPLDNELLEAGNIFLYFFVIVFSAFNNVGL